MEAINDAYSIDQFAAEDEYAADKKMEWLTEAVAASYRAMERFRALNRNLVEAYAGPGYMGQDEDGPKYLEKLSEAIDAYVTLLFSGDPECDIEGMKLSLQAFAFTYQQSVNQLGKEIHLRDTVEQWIIDACILLGIVKVHTADSGETIFADGLAIDPGIPNATNISLDEWVVDMSAKNYRFAKFAGDKYRIPYKEFKQGVEMGIYDPMVAKDVRPSSKRSDVGDTVAEAMRNGEQVDADDVEPMIDLADVWVPRDRKVYTFVVRSRRTFELDPRPIAELDWNDSESGPYLLLGFRKIPDAIFPKSPALHLNDLATLIDNIASLVARQAKRQKNLTAYEASSEPDARRVRVARDGGVLRVDNVAGLKPIVIPGADPSSVALLMQLMQLYDVSAGNLTALMGTGAQAETAQAETLIHQASNRKVAWMQERVATSVAQLYRSLGFLLWNDQWRTIVTQLPVPGAESYVATFEWTPYERAGNFFDYNFTVSASSLIKQAPAERAQALGQLVSQIYIPLMQMLAAQGGRIDLAALTDMYAELLNQPRLKSLIVFDQQPNPMDDAPSTGLRKPPTSTRHYVRHNTGGGASPQDALTDFFKSQPSLGEQFSSTI